MILATIVIGISLLGTYLIVSWVNFMVKTGKDNVVTVLGPIVIVLWLILAFFL